MKKLTRKQQVEVKILQEQLEGVSKNQVLDKGSKTRQLLNTLGIISPSLKGAILVSLAPNTWIVPLVELDTEDDKQAWIKKMRKKYRL